MTVQPGSIPGVHHVEVQANIQSKALVPLEDRCSRLVLQENNGSHHCVAPGTGWQVKISNVKKITSITYRA